MARLSRVTQTIFASLAGLHQISEFGSLAQGSPTFTTDPAAVQTATFAAGWFSAVLGNNSPAMEDFNAVFFEMTYQLAYICQLGVQEWDAATTYYIGSVANDGTGNIYVSLTNTNLNNALSSTANWRLIAGPVMTALGDLIYGGTGGNFTRLAGNTTTTKKFLSQTGTGSVSAAPAWSAMTAPTLTRLTSGSGTYTPPAGVLWLKIKASAAGGGGGGNGNTATAGTDGGDTTLGLIITCSGGKGAAAGGAGGAGGASSISAPAVGRAQAGTAGALGQPGVSTGLGGIGGGGGSNPFGGAPLMNMTGTNGLAGLANTGAGGQGGATGAGGSQQGGGGGGGGYADVLVTTILASYAYSIGAGGAGGIVGASGTATGGNGADGVIEIEEHYQ